MNEIYTVLTPVLLGIAGITLTAAGYLWYRNKELIILAKELLDLVNVAKKAYEDKNVSEEEYGIIISKLNDVANKLKDVIYKR